MKELSENRARLDQPSKPPRRRTPRETAQHHPTSHAQKNCSEGAPHSRQPARSAAYSREGMAIGTMFLDITFSRLAASSKVIRAARALLVTGMRASQDCS